MNGELGEIYNRIIRLETQNEEKWIAHNERSNEMRVSLENELQNINQSIGFIRNKVSSLPCEVHTERFKGFQNSIAWLYAWIGGVAGLSIYGFFFLLAKH